MKQKEVIEDFKNREDEEGTRMYFVEKEKLNELMLHEDLYWKQRAKTFWLKEGDTNSKFFHAAASNRKKKKFITGLKSEDGTMVTNYEELYSMLKMYYNNFFAGVDIHTNLPSSDIG